MDEYRQLLDQATSSNAWVGGLDWGLESEIFWLIRWANAKREKGDNCGWRRRRLLSRFRSHIVDWTNFFYFTKMRYLLVHVLCFKPSSLLQNGEEGPLYTVRDSVNSVRHRLRRLCIFCAPTVCSR